MSERELFGINKVAAGWFEVEPPPYDFVVNGLAVGSIGALVAPGGTGKSMFALQLACAVAGGQQANTLSLDIKKNGNVIYASLEDSLSDIQQRMYALGQHFNTEAKENILKRLHFLTDDSCCLDLMQSAVSSKLIEKAKEINCTLLIVDTLSDIHTLDENDNGLMLGLVKQLKHIARQANLAVIYLHHTNKAATLSGQGNTQQAARGASTLIDKARWCGTLSKMTSSEAEKLEVAEDKRGYFLKYEIAKKNYGESEHSRWYERKGGGVLTLVEFNSARPKKTRGSNVL